jgi:hypothetical protein
METKRRELLESAKTAYADFAKNYGHDAKEEFARTLFRQGVIAELLKGGSGDEPSALDFHKQALCQQLALLSGNAKIAGNENDISQLIVQATQQTASQNFDSRDPALRFDLANTLNAIGNALKDDDRETSRAAFELALAVRQKLAEKEKSSRNQRKLANTLMNLSTMERKTGDVPDALRHIQESNSLRSESSFNDYEWKRDHAVGLANEARLLISAPNPELQADQLAARQQEAIRKCEAGLRLIDGLLKAPQNTEAEDIRSKIVQYLLFAIRATNDRTKEAALLIDLVERNRTLRQDSPEVPEFQVQLSKALINLGDFHYRGVDLDERDTDWSASKTKYEEALEIFAKLNPGENRRDRAYAQLVIAKIEDHEDNLDSARQRIDQAVIALDALAQQDPASQDYKTLLADAKAFQHKVVGRQLLLKGNMDEAIMAWESAIDSYEQMGELSPFKQWQLDDCKKLLAEARTR